MQGAIHWDEGEIQSGHWDVLLGDFDASMLKLLKHRGLALAEGVWMIKPEIPQPLSLTEPPDVPRIAESVALETK